MSSLQFNRLVLFVTLAVAELGTCNKLPVNLYMGHTNRKSVFEHVQNAEVHIYEALPGFKGNRRIMSYISGEQGTQV